MVGRKSVLVAAILVAGVVFMCPAAVEACPTCKDGISENSLNLVRGFGWSIIFMMSMPFLILGGLGSYFYLEVRRARRQLDQQEDQTHLSATPSSARTALCLRPSWLFVGAFKNYSRAVRSTK